MNRAFYRFAVWLVRWYYKCVYRVSIVGKEHISDSSHYLVVANHNHWKDPLAVAAFLPSLTIHFMGKKEAFRYAFNAYWLRKLGVFPVDRNQKDILSFRRAMRLLRQKNSVGIFPEGTRNKTYQPLDIKGGAVMLAAKTNTKLLPVSIDASFRWFHPLQITVHEPVEVSALSGKTYDQVANDVMLQIYQHVTSG